MFGFILIVIAIISIYYIVKNSVNSDNIISYTPPSNYNPISATEQRRLDKKQAVLWAQHVLNRKNEYLILDTETTGLTRASVIVQIAITDMFGNALINSLVRPTQRKRMPVAAKEIHGISMKDLVDAPTFAELKPQIEEIIRGKNVIIYNAEYDEKLIMQTCDQDDCGFLSMNTSCAMLPYSAYIGNWNEYFGDYKWQKLRGGDHSALGDCKATLKTIQRMAKAKVI